MFGAFWPWDLPRPLPACRISEGGPEESPFPRQAEGKYNFRFDFASFRFVHRAFSSTGRRESQCCSDFAAFRRVHRALFLDRQGEKPSVAKAMNSSCLSDSMMASPSTGRGERSSQAHVLAFQSQRSIVFYDVLKAFFSKRGFEHGAVQKAFPACMPMKMALWTQRELANFGARKKYALSAGQPIEFIICLVY